MYQSVLLPVPSSLYEKSFLLHLPKTAPVRGVLLYFHGGGLLYGSKADLPEYHLLRLTEAGFAVIAFDYPLAPDADMEMILNDTLASIRFFAEGGIPDLSPSLPYFLWGRSAGAYLSLLAGTRLFSFSEGQAFALPSGILSFYGYGFFTDGWYETPCTHYLKYPPVTSSPVSAPRLISAEGSPESRLALYISARQKGNWIELLSRKRKDVFLRDCSLKFSKVPPVPVFAAHSIHDPDVPYTEFEALCEKYNPIRYLSTSKDHDFDRTDGTFLQKLFLDSVIGFLEGQLTEPSEKIR